MKKILLFVIALLLISLLIACTDTEGDTNMTNGISDTNTEITSDSDIGSSTNIPADDTPGASWSGRY